jgi:hypothetical protein
MRISQRLFIIFWINFCNIFTYKYILYFINIKYIYKILSWIMNILWDIRIFFGLVPKESLCMKVVRYCCTFHNLNVFKTTGCVILNVIRSTNLPIESSVFTAWSTARDTCLVRPVKKWILRANKSLSLYELNRHLRPLRPNQQLTKRITDS